MSNFVNFLLNPPELTSLVNGPLRMVFLRFIRVGATKLGEPCWNYFSSEIYTNNIVPIICSESIVIINDVSKETLLLHNGFPRFPANEG